MELRIYEAVAEKIWTRHKVTHKETQEAWEIYKNSVLPDDEVLYDHREASDPSPQWFLVRVNRRVLKVVFIVYDLDDDCGYLVTAYPVDRRTERTCEILGGRIYG